MPAESSGAPCRCSRPPHGLLNNDEAKLAVEVDTGVEITTASRGLLKYKTPGPIGSPVLST